MRHQDFEDYAKATPVERGCGRREKGGVYLECGLSPFGKPFDDFLLCPPQEPPEGLNLTNKPQLWSPNPESEEPVYHVLIWIGESHYQFLPDYLEEARRFGLSRRIRNNFSFEKLTPGKSRMVLLHPRALNTRWQEQGLPEYCPKGDLLDPAHTERSKKAEQETEGEGLGTGTAAAGPCIGKLYQLLPIPPGQSAGHLAFREMPSFSYTYTPTGEGEDWGAIKGLKPAIFGVFPITGLALIKRDDGSVNEKAEAKIKKTGLNYYQADE